MKIELLQTTVREVTKGYIDNAEEGVFGYGGNLNIRPKYQREFIYDEKKRNAVMDTISKNFPLNIMYWVKNTDGTFELLDGQQRTISFCQYVKGDYSIDNKAFHNLTITEQEQILNYELMVYSCEGNDKEKLDWFKIINISGVKLTDQELRNVVYTGTWLTSAKSIFSKSNCAAYLLSKDYMSGSAIRQEILETALYWISDSNIEGYMSCHQHDPNANELWMYFRNVIDWVRITFTTHRKEMKNVDWGRLYNQYKGVIIDTTKLENEISTLMMDDDVNSKSGIYPYVLTGNERHLNIRVFSESMKREAYERQRGICPVCKQKYELEQMEGDHITPWIEGGKTNAANCQMLCKLDNRMKGSR